MTPDPAPQAPGGVGDRRVFVAMVALIFAGGLAGGIGAPLVSALARAEGVPLAVAQWSVTGNVLVAAIAAPLIGRLGTGRRQRPVLVTAMGLAALGTVLSALPLGIAGVLTGRSLQGLAVAAQPLALAVGRAALAPEKQRSGTALLSASIVAAAGLGFPVAGLLGEHLGVRGAFAFGAALVVGAFLLSLVLTPSGEGGGEARLDVVGAGLLAVATLALLVAIGQARTWGYASAPVLALLVLGVAVAVVAVVWLRRVEDPLVDLSLARHPVVLAAHLASLFCGTGMYMLLMLCLVIGQADPLTDHGLGLGVATAGFLLLPYSVFSVTSSRLGLVVGRVLGARAVLPTGCGIFALSLVWLAVAHHEPWQLFVAMTLGGLGSGLSFTSIPWLVTEVVPASENASVLSLNIVLRFVGFAVGSVASLAVIEAVGGHAVTHAGFVAACAVAASSCALAAAISGVLMRRQR